MSQNKSTTINPDEGRPNAQQNGVYTRNGSSDKEGNGENKKRTDKERKNDISRGFLPKLLCFFAALLVWFYVYGNKTTTFEKEFYNVPITFEGVSELESRGYTLLSGANTLVKVVLSGSRSSVNSVSDEDLKIRCNLSELYTSGEYTLPLTYNSPSGTTVLSVAPGNVSVYVDKSETKTIEVRAEIKSGGTTDLSLKIEELQPFVQTVKVTGPKEELEKIAYAAVDVHLSGLIEKTTEWMGELHLVDVTGAVYSNDYVSTSVNTVKVRVPVVMYKTVPVTLKVDEKDGGSLLGYNCKVTPEFVEICGNKDIIDKIDVIETELTDLSDISGAAKISAPLDIPSGVETVNPDDEIVFVEVTRNVQNRKNVKTENIVALNIPDGYSVAFEEKSLSVEFVGPHDELEKLSSKNVYAVADLVNCDGIGKYVVNLNVRFPSEIKDTSIEGSYRCVVEITSAE